MPQRAHTIRSILLEVERHTVICSTLASPAILLVLIPAYAIFPRAGKVDDDGGIADRVRKTYGLNLIGGVRRDILKEHVCKR